MTGEALGGRKGAAGNSEGGWPNAAHILAGEQGKAKDSRPTVAVGMGEHRREQHRLSPVPKLELHICSIFVISQNKQTGGTRTKLLLRVCRRTIA